MLKRLSLLLGLMAALGLTIGCDVDVERDPYMEDSIEETADNVEESMEETGDAISDSVDDASDAVDDAIDEADTTE